ncbi:hypothetical protein B0I00_0720 [Novosphingobium kunmingense]|uniref:Uncharacterized protein n=1 Tax=Novosphingobium kunmingense TaxID=1211806 RepID=A0A2N0I2T8_9SPHN|nr:hypothetical protein [Novosphingobium kunmingense]PKB25519.1 hypothetical protein B0I00_0720 [Novosphingobium kunmingense]
MNAALFALAALLPSMIGPLPQAPRSLAVALCADGKATIPLPARDDRPAPCAQKGCHAGCSRKRF